MSLGTCCSRNHPRKMWIVGLLVWCVFIFLFCCFASCRRRIWRVILSLFLEAKTRLLNVMICITCIIDCWWKLYLLYIRKRINQTCYSLFHQTSTASTSLDSANLNLCLVWIFYAISMCGPPKYLHILLHVSVTIHSCSSLFTTHNNEHICHLAFLHHSMFDPYFIKIIFACTRYMFLSK